MGKGNDSQDPSLQTYIAHALTAEGFDASEDGTGRGTPLTTVMRMREGCAGGGKGPLLSEDLSLTLATANDQTVFSVGQNIRGEIQTSDVIPALSAGGGKPGQGYPCVAFSAGNSADAYGIAITEEGTPPLRAAESGTNQVPSVQYGMAVRRLTPTECERLQGFPDGWTDGQSDSARYRQLGNAVCVPVAEWLGRRIMAVAS